MLQNVAGLAGQPGNILQHTFGFMCYGLGVGPGVGVGIPVGAGVGIGVGVGIPVPRDAQRDRESRWKSPAGEWEEEREQISQKLCGSCHRETQQTEAKEVKRV